MGTLVIAANINNLQNNFSTAGPTFKVVLLYFCVGAGDEALDGFAVTVWNEVAVADSLRLIYNSRHKPQPDISQTEINSVGRQHL